MSTSNGFRQKPKHFSEVEEGTRIREDSNSIFNNEVFIKVAPFIHNGHDYNARNARDNSPAKFQPYEFVVEVA